MAAFLNRRQAAIDLISPLSERLEATTSILVYGEVVEYTKGLADFPVRHAQLKVLLREVVPTFLPIPFSNATLTFAGNCDRRAARSDRRRRHADRGHRAGSRLDRRHD